MKHRQMGSLAVMKATYLEGIGLYNTNTATDDDVLDQLGYCKKDE